MKASSVAPPRRAWSANAGSKSKVRGIQQAEQGTLAEGSEVY